MIFRTILLNSVCLLHKYREAQDLIIKDFTILRETMHFGICICFPEAKTALLNFLFAYAT